MQNSLGNECKMYYSQSVSLSIFVFFVTWTKWLIYRSFETAIDAYIAKVVKIGVTQSQALYLQLQQCEI